MKTPEVRFADLEAQMRLQGRVIDHLSKKIQFLERENVRQKTEIERLKRERS